MRIEKKFAMKKGVQLKEGDAYLIYTLTTDYDASNILLIGFLK